MHPPGMLVCPQRNWPLTWMQLFSVRGIKYNTWFLSAEKKCFWRHPCVEWSLNYQITNTWENVFTQYCRSREEIAHDCEIVSKNATVSSPNRAKQTRVCTANCGIKQEKEPNQRRYYKTTIHRSYKRRHEEKGNTQSHLPNDYRTT